MTTPKTFKITLPHLGLRTVQECLSEPRHWLWLSLFGWHDCNPDEDELCNAQQESSQ